MLAASGAVLAFCMVVIASRAAWPGASLTAPGGTATGTLAFTHSYGASLTCAAGPLTPSASCPGELVSGAVTGTSPLTAADTIASTGNVATGALTQTVTVTSCEPVAFANTTDAVNPLLDRFGTSFNQTGPFAGAGSVTFDGSSGYATSVVSQPQPVTAPGTFSGIGIWFKLPPGSAGPLFSFGASGANGAGLADRALYLDRSGQLTFVWNTAGAVVGPTSTTGGYANGVWHFAYVTLWSFGTSVPKVTVYVDGIQAASLPFTAVATFSQYPGYWHLGYAPISMTGLATAYFGGSLSNFVVFDGTSFPTPTTDPISATSFAAFAAGATEWWPLGDSGTSTFTGTLPVVGTGSGTIASAACKSLDLGWSFINPNGTAASGTTSLYYWVTTPAGIAAVSPPGPGAHQLATLTLAHDPTYDTYDAGLHLWVPMASTITTPGQRWALAFQWTPTVGATIIPAP